MKINLRDYACEYDGIIVSNPTAEEGGRSFTLKNDSKVPVKKWAIEKVVLKNYPEKKCDYLLRVEKNKHVYYWIELKGGEINEGYKQILNTINNIRIETSAIHQARIIATKNRKPNIRNKEYFKLEGITRESGGEILVRINHYSEII